MTRRRFFAHLSHWTSGALYFVVGRGAVLVFPLMLAAFAPIETYGRVEFALAVAGILGVALEGGVTAALTYFTLRRGCLEYLASARAYGTLILLVSIASGLLFLVLDKTTTAMIIIVSGMIAGQGIAAGIRRVTGRPHQAFLFDSLLYAIGAVALLYAVVNGSVPSFASLVWVWTIASIGLMVMCAVSVWRAAISARHLIWRAMILIAFGRPLILSAFLASSLVLLGRGLSGVLLGDVDTGIFSFYFRIASIALVAHGFVQTMLFRDLYGSDVRRSARIFWRNLVIILFFGMVITISAPLIVNRIPSFSIYEIDSNLGLMGLLASTVVTRAATAQQELIIYQEKMAGVMIRRLAFIIGAFVGVAYFLSIVGVLDVVGLATIYGGALYAYLLSQYRMLIGRGIDVRASTAIVSVAVALGMAFPALVRLA